MTEPLPKRISISPQVLFQDFEEQCVLLNLDTEHYFSLDDVGARAWRLLAEDGEVAPAVAQLLAEYDVDEATLVRDLAELFSKLVEAGLVTAS